MIDYETFLARKRFVDVPTGFEPRELFFNENLFDFQRDCVTWACRRGRAALFEDCGLGKTIQELSWAEQVTLATGGNVLILMPLGVAIQTVREAEKFGFDIKQVSEQAEVDCPISITNYQKLHRFDLSKFKGLVLDESSILKSYDGKTRTQIIESSRPVPYKLAASATPSPNDYMELGNHAEFLGVMSRTEMLATFFVHDGGDTAKWRLKGHAEQDFWQWLCSWAVNLRKPSDLGYDDGDFKLPPLNLIEHTVSAQRSLDGYLLSLPASTLEERRNAKRVSINERCKLAADIVTERTANTTIKTLIWCELNTEQDKLEKLFGDACVSIRGATEEDERMDLERQWREGPVPVLISKPSIFGFGMNWQHCSEVIFVGLTDSYEQFYQALRRNWRFGQKYPVNAHIITSELEGAVLANIHRKEADANRMANEMVKHMAAISSAVIKGACRESVAYNPTIPMQLPCWLAGQLPEID